jgi:hypothetical protein
MLVILRVHIEQVSPVVPPYQRGVAKSGRALDARPRWDTARKHTLSPGDLQVLFRLIALLINIFTYFLYVNSYVGKYG